MTSGKEWERRQPDLLEAEPTARVGMKMEMNVIRSGDSNNAESRTSGLGKSLRCLNP